MIARDAHSTDLISRQTKTVAIEKFWMTRSIERAHAHLARVQIAEEAFRQSLLSSQGSLGIFFSNPLVGTIMGLGLIALFWPLIQNTLARLLQRPRTAL